MSRFCKFGKLHVTKGNVDKLLGILLTASKELKRSLDSRGSHRGGGRSRTSGSPGLQEFDSLMERMGSVAKIRNHVIAVSCVKLLSAHNSTQHTSRKHKV